MHCKVSSNKIQQRNISLAASIRQANKTCTKQAGRTRCGVRARIDEGDKVDKTSRREEGSQWMAMTEMRWVSGRVRESGVVQ